MWGLSWYNVEIKIYFKKEREKEKYNCCFIFLNKTTQFPTVKKVDKRIILYSNLSNILWFFIFLGVPDPTEERYIKTIVCLYVLQEILWFLDI